MHIGKQIRQARRVAGLTQEQLADLINKTRPLISHIENTGNINPYTLSALKKVLDFDNSQVNEHAGYYQKDNNSAQSTQLLQEKLINTLSEEIETLKELVTTQREIIEMLKNQK